MMNKLVYTLLIVLMALSVQNCQSRVLSRYTGNALKLELPSDFNKPISFNSGRKGDKKLFYWSTDGHNKVNTYTDWELLDSEIVFVDKK